MIALTIDSEQWNCPLLEGKRVEENGDTSFSRDGNEVLLDILDEHDIKATFFITGAFAEEELGQVKRINKNGHEIACHGHDHFYRGNPSLDLKEDIMRAKGILEEVTSIKGFRAPQMQYSQRLLRILDELGFEYDSSLHPAILPGYYNNSRMPLDIFRPLEGSNILEVPVAVSSYRFPVSWLFMRLFGVNRVISSFKYLMRKGITPVLYVHSWEFIGMKSAHVPFYYNYRTGKPFVEDFTNLIEHFRSEGFTTLSDLTEKKHGISS
ncbi:MAG: polysaccharide deacetylase family protein [Candidatus Undinarchaeales archaeon]|nr:polysaccharide deacetylase family protein [Candidatus Undinarchaeales archaeon]MDP7491981.1 polysaccharide deacetylase family protein [Candidatus Undinarchaeales archaeon]